MTGKLDSNFKRLLDLVRKLSKIIDCSCNKNVEMKKKLHLQSSNDMRKAQYILLVSNYKI